MSEMQWTLRIMSEKLTMPKNVQAFVNKYGRIGSKEQDAAFWKEFRKAANAYADVQAKRICDLEHALTAVTEQRDAVTLRLGESQERMIDAERQRDRLAEVMAQILNTQMNHTRRELLLEQALQSLTPKP
jgi:hypothetical protein